MFVLDVKPQCSNHKVSYYYESLEEAVKNFKLNDKLGHFCAVYNLK